MHTHYDVLGIAATALAEDIKKAYRKLVLKCHPDRIHDEEKKTQGTEQFQAVQKAYDILSNPKTRAAYDLGLEGDKPTKPHFPRDDHADTDTHCRSHRHAHFGFRMPKWNTEDEEPASPRYADVDDEDELDTRRKSSAHRPSESRGWRRKSSDHRRENKRDEHRRRSSEFDCSRASSPPPRQSHGKHYPQPHATGKRFFKVEEHRPKWAAENDENDERFYEFRGEKKRYFDHKGQSSSFFHQRSSHRYRSDRREDLPTYYSKRTVEIPDPSSIRYESNSYFRSRGPLSPRSGNSKLYDDFPRIPNIAVPRDHERYGRRHNYEGRDLGGGYYRIYSESSRSSRRQSDKEASFERHKNGSTYSDMPRVYRSRRTSGSGRD